MSNQNAVDLSRFENEIPNDEDRLLFHEAVLASRAGALRAAYIMIWLACAESIKRRFRQLQRQDDEAGRIVAKIDKTENMSRAVDKLLLEKAREYGLLSGEAHTVLLHVYQMRCIYAHPYEAGPSPTQVAHAAEAVVRHVLSKPVLLRQGFAQQVVRHLTEDPQYLDDYQIAVESFASTIVSRLDQSVYGWMLSYYLEKLEEIANDASMAPLLRRGIWFCRQALRIVGVDVFSPAEWHDNLSRFPSVLTRVVAVPEIFRDIGAQAQDSVVGRILSHCSISLRGLGYIETLNNAGLLSERQQTRFLTRLSQIAIQALPGANLRIKTCYANIISALKSYNWYIQNPAIELLVARGPSESAELCECEQIQLGRNILQAAQGGARAAEKFLHDLGSGEAKWSFHVVRGIGHEIFTNERGTLRLKIRHLDSVLSAIHRLSQQEQALIADEIAAAVQCSAARFRLAQEDIESACAELGKYRWATPILSALKSKFTA